MASEVDIANSALNMIGASNINSLTEDSVAARIVNQRYTFVRDAVFRSHPWNSLIRRATLAENSTAPTWGFTKAYNLPTDPFCLRVLRIENLDINFRVEGRTIVTDETTMKINGGDVFQNNTNINSQITSDTTIEENLQVQNN